MSKSSSPNSSRLLDGRYTAEVLSLRIGLSYTSYVSSWSATVSLDVTNAGANIGGEA